MTSKWPLDLPGYRKQDASYSPDFSAPSLAALPEKLAGFQCSQQCPECLPLLLQLPVLGSIPGSLCFKCWVLCLKTTPEGRLDIFCFPSRPILHLSPPSAAPREAESNQVCQQLESASGGYQQEIRRLEIVIEVSSLKTARSHGCTPLSSTLSI